MLKSKRIKNTMKTFLLGSTIFITFKTSSYGMDPQLNFKQGLETPAAYKTRIKGLIIPGHPCVSILTIIDAPTSTPIVIQGKIKACYDAIAQQQVQQADQTEMLKKQKEIADAEIRRQQEVAIAAEQKRQEAEQKVQEEVRARVLAEQQAQTAQKEKEAVIAASALSPGEIQAIIAKSNATIGNFARDLYLMKFAGDLDPDFLVKIKKIADATTALKSIKEEFDHDIAIPPLNTYLRILSPIGMDTFLASFLGEKKSFSGIIDAKIQIFSDALEDFKNKFIEMKGNAKIDVSISGRLSRVKEAEFFQHFDDLRNLYQTIHIFLSGDASQTPDIFVLELHNVINANKGEHIIENIDKFIGTKNVTNDSMLEASQDLLSLYTFISSKNSIGDAQVSEFLASLSRLLISAVDLMMQLFQVSEFVPASDGITIKNDRVIRQIEKLRKDYRQIKGKGALFNALKSNIDPNTKTVPYQAIYDSFKARDNQDRKLTGLLSNSNRKLVLASKSTGHFYNQLIPLVSSTLWQSNLSAEKRDKKIEDIKKFFPEIEKIHREKMEFLTYFGENLADKKKREDANNLATERAKGATPILEKEPQLSIDNSQLKAVVSNYISDGKSFENLWDNEFKEKATKYLKPEDIKVLKLILEELFTLVSEDVATNLDLALDNIKKIVAAQKAHQSFSNALEAAAVEFKTLVAADVKGYPTIANKLAQLAVTMNSDPSSYLDLDPLRRATEFVYNLPMLYNENLQPDVNDIQIFMGGDLNAFYQKLQTSYNQYLQVRNHIQSIDLIDPSQGEIITITGFHSFRDMSSVAAGLVPPPSAAAASRPFGRDRSFDATQEIDKSVKGIEALINSLAPQTHGVDPADVLSKSKEIVLGKLKERIYEALTTFDDQVVAPQNLAAMVNAACVEIGQPVIQEIIDHLKANPPRTKSVATSSDTSVSPRVKAKLSVAVDSIQNMSLKDAANRMIANGKYQIISPRGAVNPNELQIIQDIQDKVAIIEAQSDLTTNGISQATITPAGLAVAIELVKQRADPKNSITTDTLKKIQEITVSDPAKHVLIMTSLIDITKKVNGDDVPLPFIDARFDELLLNWAIKIKENDRSILAAQWNALKIDPQVVSADPATKKNVYHIIAILTLGNINVYKKLTSMRNKPIDAQWDKHGEEYLALYFEGDAAVAGQIIEPAEFVEAIKKYRDGI